MGVGIAVVVIVLMGLMMVMVMAVVVVALRGRRVVVVLAGAEYARPFAFGAKGDRVKDRLGVAVQEVFLGAKTAPEALKDACTEIDQLTQL